MKSDLPVMAQRRASIARLLWRFRSLRRSHVSRDEMLEQLSQLKNEAGPAFRYVSIRFTPGDEADDYQLTFAVNKTLLRRAKQKQYALSSRAHVRRAGE